jgi:hypothetical protein
VVVVPSFSRPIHQYAGNGFDSEWVMEYSIYIDAVDSIDDCN